MAFSQLTARFFSLDVLKQGMIAVTHPRLLMGTFDFVYGEKGEKIQSDLLSYPTLLTCKYILCLNQQIRTIGG